MLTPLPSPGSIAPEAYFCDHFQRTLYSLQEGCLTAHQQAHNLSQPIHINLSSPAPQPTALPSLMVLTGDIVSNAQGNIVASSTDLASVRSTVEVKDNSHWQWHVPISLSNIELGLLVKKGEGVETEELTSFNSSTSRTVSFWLKGKELNVWINGTQPHKKSVKIIEYDPTAHKLYPFAKIKEKGSTLIFIPFLTTPVLPISAFNPFGSLYPDCPALQCQSLQKQSQQLKISKLISLSESRMLLIWQNNRVQVISRNSNDQFQFSSSHVDNQTVFGLFTKEEHQALKNWRQEGKQLLEWKESLPLRFAFEWIRYLICQLDCQHSSRTDLYGLLLKKLIAIRPYLGSIGINIPNLLLHCSQDIQIYSSALNYFQGYSNIKKSLLNLSDSSSQKQVQGDIRCITQNYLLSFKNDMVVLYCIGKQIKQVFRENIQNFNFSKRNLIESYKQSDLRYLQKDGSYLYKILNSSLNSKKEEEIYAVNPEHLKQLRDVFKIQETIATTALKNTGGVEEALVWIFGKKRDKTTKNEIISQENKDGDHSFSMIEVKTIFTRLLVTVDSNVFVLGVTPSQMHQWIQRKQNQFIDLNSFKHEHTMQEINFEKWYQGKNHPNLHLLDLVQLSSKPETLILDNKKVYFVFSNEDGRQQQEIIVKNHLLFEEKDSISEGEQTTPLSDELQKGQLVKSIQGELIGQKIDEKSYEPGTTIVIGKKLYSNSNLLGSTAVRITMKVDPSLLTQTGGSSHILPLTIEQCPPGVNKNYSISSLLLSSGSFLGNYPQGLMMRHLHGKAINVRSFKLKRCVNRKNVNYIEKGSIIFKDVWGHNSKKYEFEFQPAKEEVTITFDEGRYCKSVYLQPKFTTLKKLPFQIGSFSVQGSCLPQQAYLSQHSRKIQKLLNNQSENRIFLLSLKTIEKNILQLNISSSNFQGLEYFAIKNDKVQIITKKGVIIPKITGSFNEIQCLAPDELIKYMTKNITNSQRLFRHLAKSLYFKLDHFQQKNVRKFVDLVVFSAQDIDDQEYYEQIFSKIWNSTHGKQYLLKFAVSFCEVPLIPLKFLKLLLSNLPQDYHQLTLKAALQSVNELRSKEYKTLIGDYPYLYFQNQFYSDYYYDLINPSKKQRKIKIFNEPIIKSEIIVFKSDFTRRIITKLPSKYVITNTTLRAERSDIASKIRYSVFVLTPQGKVEVGSGFILEHQWSQITKLPYKPEIEKIYDCESSSLNMIGLDLGQIEAQYLEIELNFTETGVVGHESEINKIAQVDILPELYGFSIQQSEPLPIVENYLNFNPEDMFFLSMTPLLKTPMKKYSISKGKNIEFIYFSPQKEDIGALKVLLSAKIQKKQFDSIVSIQRRLIQNKVFSHKLTLDYLYTLIALTLAELQRQNLKVSDNICEKLYSTLVEGAHGPIKILCFKAISHKINLLIKSLQYIEKELDTLGKISFSYEQLIDVTDFGNTDLCKSLTKLILRGVPYEQKWVELLIRMSPRTESHQEIISYFIDQEDWLNNLQILDYLSSLSDELYINYFLNCLSFKHLSKMVLTPTAKPRLDILLETIVDRASDKNPVDLDVISLIFQQREVRWEQLQTVISSCPQATDTVIHQFLQSDTPELLAREHSLLFSSAAAAKYDEQFAIFLDKIYHRDKKALAELFLGLGDKCSTLHYDFLETIGNFITDLCNFGGVEGAKLLSERELVCLHAAVEMLKRVEKLPQGAELPNEDLFIDWYLSNNDYELTSTNPANKSPAHHLMKHLVEKVLSLIKAANPSKVLNKYMTTLNDIKLSKRISLTKRHLLFNQLHHGASSLLCHTLTPGLLANVFVGGENPLLVRVINELKTTLMKKSSKSGKWLPSKETELTEHFDVKDIADIKDIQIGKGGSKSAAFKIATSHKSIKMNSQDSRFPTKVAIGFCLNDNAENKNALLPSRVEVFGGNDKTMLKIGNMSLIDDQYYLASGVRVFALNLNSVSSLGIGSIKNIEFKLHDSQLCSVSDVLESGQKNKKNATFNVSFISIYGYDSQPSDEPDYSEMYVTLLGFLGQSKYQEDLKAVIKSPHFDQKLQLVIQVLNDLLPNDDIESLLLALNREGENILEHVLKSKGANPKIVNSLIMGKLNKQNINKLISHTLENISVEFVNIVTMSLRLGSYELPSRKPSDSVSDFENIKHLLETYEKSKDQSKKLYCKMINSILTVPNLYNYDISKFLSFVWAKPQRFNFYSILAAILPYHPSQLENCSSKKYVLEVFDELLTIMTENQTSNSVVTNPQNHIELLCTLSLNENCKNQLLEKKAPIKIVELIKSNSSILVKYTSEVMKLFISFFQTTCIDTSCQDEFSQILINVMTSLNEFNPIHHNFFIHSFFFPLINAFKGVPLLFVWKYNNQYLKQVTQVLKFKPIKSSSNVLTFQNSFFQPISSVDQDNLGHTLLFIEKASQKVCFKLSQKVMWDVSAKKERKYEFKEGKVTIELSKTEKVILSSDDYKVYEENEWEKNLLTNTTLQGLNNPWILDEKYQGISHIKESTIEKCYFVPGEMNINDLLKQINIGGFRIHPSDLSEITVRNYITGKEVIRESNLKTLLTDQKEAYLKLEIQASSIFKNTTIETLVKEEFNTEPFVAKQTIFKAFEQKKGLQKMITVLKGCVTNWTSTQQMNIWSQYLKELESYSCFPVFSHLYINKQSNVALLFDILLGLPDKQDSKKWIQKEKESVKQLYTIIKDVFAVKGEQATVVRQYALKSGFYSTMLDRLYLITKEPKRVKNDEIKEEQEQEVLPTPTMDKKNSEEDYADRLKKRTGVGYGTDTSTNQKWDVTGQEEARKQKSDQILSLLTILEQFLDCDNFEYPIEILDQTYESSLLPIIESSLRGGSLLQISKYAELFNGELSFVHVLAKCKQLIPVLMSIPNCYQPKQSESIHSLLKTLANTSNIFLSCLTGSASQKTSEEIAKKIKSTFEVVDQAVSEYQTIHHTDEDQQKKIMDLPLQKKYPPLMKDLRFDYIDMKDSANKITKHHYASNYQPGHKPPVDKTIRLAQELADLSHALPIDHTNAIYVRCDKERVDFMQALIMGSNGTPYGHGAYLFDIYFEDTYPSGPPKVNLMTTGSGQIRFNPNLYACGKVCLSLLGTWRGNAMENWDAKVSTLLQVLVSIQSIIMSEDIYFNEPGFQHEQGTPEGQKKNQAYANIVRYGNVKFAMLQNIKNPPKGFQSVIRRHFYLKKDEILEQCRKWIKFAEKREASYNGLVSDHNYNWCNNFKKSKNEYKNMLEKAVKELEDELNKLPPPTSSDFKKQNLSPVKPRRKHLEAIKEAGQDINLEEVDVSYGEAHQHQELDVNDEKVKDRWSRYIGAMGVEAVTKQSKANILLLGLGAVGVETAKNIVLSGCRQFAVWDDKTVKYSDLSGQFYLTESDIDKPRLQSCFYKLQELNYYVKMTKFEYKPEDLSNLNNYQLVIATERSQEELVKLNAHCRENKIHFISLDCYGPFGQIFNDFGENFEVLDKDGEEPTEVLIEDISIAEKGVVKLVKGFRHPYEDGDTVRLAGVKGMKSLANEAQTINGTIHVIKVIDHTSFEIENTANYSAYEGEGTVKNIKTPKTISFKSLQSVNNDPNIESNLEYYDWFKSGKLKLLHTCFIVLSDFSKQNSRLPLSWNKEDAAKFVELIQKKKPELNEDEIKYIKLFSYTCSGTFGPICAFFGGIAAQEAFKAITGKYTPINQFFISEFSEIIETPPQEQQAWKNYVASRLPVENRTEGLRRIVGADIVKRLENSKIFMVGSGAIGCELLKNFAMLELAAGQGSIVVTDPDHIENSNLNRQFLFRQKHLRKPKSVTASAAVIQMNPRLKGHIKAKLDKVCEATRELFDNEFFENLTIVANALDNVEARRYVDSRCVESKIPMLESGTLSSKGHVQVVIPYKTETYGNMQDPNDAQGDIPHCTLKMFPEETLHCVEWARDLFGKDFTLGPKALKKLLEAEEGYSVGPSDIQMLRQCKKLIQNRPHNFDDAIQAATKIFYRIYRNDIMQLLYTYPLDAKTKDGKLFWKLPKRPPTPIQEIDPKDPLHNTLIASYSVLLAKVYGIPYPKDFRTQERRQEIAETARSIKVDPFEPSDKMAKQMAQEVDNEASTKQEKVQMEEKDEGDENQQILYQKFKQIVKDIREAGESVESQPEEFEKDDDQNGHIDMISSMANLRARNYKLEEMEWITVKLKAGRIMPALSTTTSCIAALQSIELVKYLCGCPLESMRNSFLNLAIPSLTMGEPGPVEKIKVHETLSTNIWQRWSIGPINKSQTIGDLIKSIEQKYGVTVKGLTLSQSGQIYSDFVMSLESKKEEKEKLLQKKIDKLVAQQMGEDLCKWLDFTLVMGVGQTMIKHAPTLRLLLQN